MIQTILKLREQARNEPPPQPMSWLQAALCGLFCGAIWLAALLVTPALSGN